MIFRRLLIVAALAASISTLGCDKDPEQPGVEEQKAKDEVGTAWRALLAELDGAPDDATRITALETFIGKYPEHPDLADAKSRLEALKNSDETKAKTAIEEAKPKAFDEGDTAAFATLLTVLSVERASPRSMTVDLEEPVTLPTTESPREFERGVLLTPTYVRGFVRNVFREFAPDRIEQRCGRQCINEAVSTTLEKPLGGALFVGEGKMDPEVVQRALSAFTFEPEDEIAGSTAADYYRVFKPTVHTYLTIGKKVQAADGPATGEKLASMDSEEARELYKTYTVEQKIGEGLKMEAPDVRSITSWWLRRYADGSAPAFMKHLEGVVATFEPEAK